MWVFSLPWCEKMSKVFEMRVLDLDPDNIGKTLRGAKILGAEATNESVDWADLLVVTGSTISNDTIGRFLTDKPVIFFGTTVSGAASLMGWERFLPDGRGRQRIKSPAINSFDNGNGHPKSRRSCFFHRPRHKRGLFVYGLS